MRHASWEAFTSISFSAGVSMATLSVDGVVVWQDLVHPGGSQWWHVTPVVNP